MKLIQVGFFKELPYGEKSGGSINECCFKFSGDHMMEILSYLKAGIPLAVAPGISRDCISSSHEVIGSLSLLTDGIFVWPSDLAYYVEKYKVDVPSSFCSHMKENNWKIAPVDISILAM